MVIKGQKIINLKNCLSIQIDLMHYNLTALLCKSKHRLIFILNKWWISLAPPVTNSKIMIYLSHSDDWYQSKSFSNTLNYRIKIYFLWLLIPEYKFGIGGYQSWVAGNIEYSIKPYAKNNFDREFKYMITPEV